MIETINLAEIYTTNLVNRNRNQGDGTYPADEFRQQYLQRFDNEKTWTNDENELILDFSGVKKLSPSFADEAFGYFTHYATPERIKNKFKFMNLSKIQMMILDMELDDAYRNIKANT